MATLDLEAYLADPARKQAFVTPMFDIIAPRYDAFTRAFSFGMDARWKAEARRVVVDPLMAIREAARVLRSGGTYVTLDFYRPEFLPWRLGLLSYLSLAGNLVGWTWHRSPVVYGYIARSIEHFMSWQAFSQALEHHGFRVVTVRRWLAGGVAMHVAERR